MWSVDGAPCNDAFLARRPGAAILDFVCYLLLSAWAVAGWVLIFRVVPFLSSLFDFPFLTHFLFIIFFSLFTKSRNLATCVFVCVPPRFFVIAFTNENEKVGYSNNNTSQQNSLFPSPFVSLLAEQYADWLIDWLKPFIIFFLDSRFSIAASCTALKLHFLLAFLFFVIYSLVNRQSFRHGCCSQ